VIALLIDQEVRSATHQGQDVLPTALSLAVTVSSMPEKFATLEPPMMTPFQTTAEQLAPTSLVVMVLEIGTRHATLELKTPTHQMLLADQDVPFHTVVMVLLIPNGKSVTMETMSVEITVLPPVNGNVVMDTETQQLRNATGESTMDSGLIHADQEDSSSMVFTWDAQCHSVVMVSSTVVSNAIMEETTAMLQMLADQIVPSHTVVMESEIHTMVNGVILAMVTTTSLVTAQLLAFQMSAELSFLHQEDTLTSLHSSETFHLQLSSIMDLSLILHVLRMLHIMF